MKLEGGGFCGAIRYESKGERRPVLVHAGNTTLLSEPAGGHPFLLPLLRDAADQQACQYTAQRGRDSVQLGRAGRWHAAGPCVSWPHVAVDPSCRWPPNLSAEPQRRALNGQAR